MPLGAPAIGIAAAVGISVTMSAIFSRYRKTKDDDRWAVTTHAILSPIICVAVGWVFKQFA